MMGQICSPKYLDEIAKPPGLEVIEKSEGKRRLFLEADTEDKEILLAG